MNKSRPIHISNKLHRRLTANIREVLANRTSYSDAVASWYNGRGNLDLGPLGYKSISEIADSLLKVQGLETYPKKFLLRTVAHTIIDATNVDSVMTSVIELLNDGYRKQVALVPFWGLHIEKDVRLQFGAYEFRKLGDEGFQNEVIAPFRKMREGLPKEQIADEVASFSKSLAYIPNVPILTVTYAGSSEGAEDFVAPISERVADFLHLLAAPLVGRDGVRPIDHRGAYHGRFGTFMPVLSYDLDTLDLVAFDTPNLRDNPHGPTLTIELVKEFEEMGALQYLQDVPNGPSKLDTLTSMLLRAIQLFADGERAVSDRQAIVSYIGACEAMFGHRSAAEKYTCTGIALSQSGDFQEAYSLAKNAYDQRSRAAHQGLEPDITGPARRLAYTSITYVIKNKERMPSKKHLRAWIETGFPSESLQSRMWRFIRGLPNRLISKR